MCIMDEIVFLISISHTAIAYTNAPYFKCCFDVLQPIWTNLFFLNFGSLPVLFYVWDMSSSNHGNLATYFSSLEKPFFDYVASQLQLDFMPLC